MAAIITTQVASLTTDQAVALTTTQATALVTDQVASLVTTSVAALVTTQVASLTTDSVVVLVTNQVAALTTSQATALVTDQVSPLDVMRNAILSSDNLTLRATVNNMDAYVAAMHPPKPQTQQTITQHQSNLYKTFIKALESDGQEFNQQWRTILAYFKEHTSDGKVLNALYMNRGANFIHQSIGISAATTFSNLLHICTVANSEVAFDSFKKQIDPKRAFEGLSQKAIKNLSQFYRL